MRRSLFVIGGLCGCGGFLEARPLPRPWPGPCEIRVDRGADGSVDERRVHTWSREPAPRLLSVEAFDAGGQPLSRDDFTRDAAGRVLALTHRSLAPALPESRTTFRYDEAGHLLASETRTGERIATVTWELDAGGRPLRRLAGERVERFEYDAAGLHLRSEVRDGGAIAHVLTRTYGPTGQLAEVRMDLGGDGSTDSTTTYTYDLRGRLSVLATAAAGQPATEAHHAYDEAGNLTETTRAGDAAPERTTFDYTCWGGKS